MAAPDGPREAAWYAPWRWVGIGVLLACWVIPTTLDPAWWGLSGWREVPPAWRVLLVVVPASCLLAPERLGLLRLLRRPPLPLALTIALLALALAAFWWLRSTIFWANGEVIAKLVARHQVDLKHILTTTIAVVFARALDWVQGAAPSHGILGAAWTSSLGGVAYLAGAAALGRVAYPESRLRSRSLTLIVGSAGILQHFCAVVETYPLSLPAQLWALVALVAVYRGDARAPRPRLLLATSASSAVFIATV
ncbi:MAG: hypothetical protein AAFZ65_19250, partial [Planctomycetota bacterium]